MQTDLYNYRKSQLAIEFAHQLRAVSPQTSIFWVHASNSTRFQASYKAIAVELRLPGFDDPKVDQLNAVYQWLLSESSGQWLLILDNVDDVDLVRPSHDKTRVGQHGSNISQYLPQRDGGAILITSRDRDAAFSLVNQADRLIDIKPMSKSEARSLVI